MSSSAPLIVLSMLTRMQKFWVREDGLNEQKNLIDPAVMKPIARLGGISYARITEGFEIPRPVLKEAVKSGALDEEQIKAKVDGQ